MYYTLLVWLLGIFLGFVHLISVFALYALHLYFYFTIAYTSFYLHLIVDNNH